MGLSAIVDSGFGLDGTQLGKAITLLSAQINMANHRLLRMIAEFDLHGGWRADGATRSCAHWLAANCGMAIGAAREKVRVARCLARLTEVDQAFAEGELSYSKVRAITRVATPENQVFMVCMAEQNSASHLEKLVGKYQPVEEPFLADLMSGHAPEESQGPKEGDVAALEPDEEARREQARELAHRGDAPRHQRRLRGCGRGVYPARKRPLRLTVSGLENHAFAQKDLPINRRCTWLVPYPCIWEAVILPKSTSPPPFGHPLSRGRGEDLLYLQ